MAITKADEMEKLVFHLLAVAESKIQSVMLGLEEDLGGTGWQIDALSVDTRNFANMKPEILVSKKTA